MTRWQMYSKIQSLKNLEFSKAKVARRLGINIKTVSKYWNMDADEFQKSQSIERAKKLNPHKELILSWLKQYSDITAAQISDWLKEFYKLNIPDRTVRRFVEGLRKDNHIEKSTIERQYEAAEDPPMGKQMQVDFGETLVRYAYEGKAIKLYAIGCVLSNSRYKYGEWLDRPLREQDLINMLDSCFEYMGGMPEELVFDQDKLVAVSENYGDIIYTYEFEKYKQAMGFKVRLCRKNDPESKGRIEAVVKYLKNNFAKNRYYMDLKIWNESFWEWLERTGNSKIHGTTKKIPAEVFKVEQEYLKPVPQRYTISNLIISRAVRKDNTIWYEGNRYTVPIGTYKPGLEVTIETCQEKLLIYDIIDHKLIAEHHICLEKGKLIRNNNHLRDNTSKISALHERITVKLGNTEEAAIFLKTIRQIKSRYVRDQFNLIEKVCSKYPSSIIKQALNYCVQNKLYSAVDFKDAAAYYLGKLNEESHDEMIIDNSKSSPGYMTVKTVVRDIKEYMKVRGESDHE